MTHDPDKKPGIPNAIWAVIAIALLLGGVGVLAMGWSTFDENQRVNDRIEESEAAERESDTDGECVMLSAYAEDPTDADCDDN